MKMSDSIGLEIERREKAMTFEEWIRQECFKAPPEYAVELAKAAWDYQQARIEALEKLLDPETLARKIGDWDFTHNDDYFCFKFGGDGDNGEMLIEALAALLEAEK